MVGISKADKLANKRALNDFELLWHYRRDAFPNIWFFVCMTIAIVSPIFGWNQLFNDELDRGGSWFARSGSISCLIGIVAEILLARHSLYSRKLEIIELLREFKIEMKNWSQTVNSQIACLLEKRPYTGEIDVILQAPHQITYGKNMLRLRRVIPVVNTILATIGLVVVAIATFVWGYGDIFYQYFVE